MAGAVGAAEVSSTPSSDPITVQIKFGGRTIPLSLDPESSVAHLKTLLQPLTNVIPRGQKLIFKGKVLNDIASLESLNISNGSKIMMIASEGLHQGAGPIRTDKTDGLRKAIRTNQTNSKMSFATMKTRHDRWKATGVVALSECELMAIPEEVWACEQYARVLDLRNNFIEEFSGKIGSLKSINKLLLSSNNLSAERICWEGIMHMKSLIVLALDQNQLNSLPPTIGASTTLRLLNLANNKLTKLPEEIGFLNQLEILRAENNRLSYLPMGLGNCISLTEVDFSSNLLEELPPTIGNLLNLKALHISNNGLKSLPTSLLKSCMQLTTLTLHGTEITNDILRQLEGWEAFDERRRMKHQKQLDFRVGCSDGFDEGADDDNRK